MNRIETLPTELQQQIAAQLRRQDVLNYVRARFFRRTPKPTPLAVRLLPLAWRGPFFWCWVVQTFLDFVNDVVADTAYFHARDGHSLVMLSDWSQHQKAEARPLVSFAWKRDPKDLRACDNCLPPRFSCLRFRAATTVDLKELVATLHRLWSNGCCSVRLGLHMRYQMQSGMVFHPTPFSAGSYCFFPHQALRYCPVYPIERLSDTFVDGPYSYSPTITT